MVWFCVSNVYFSSFLVTPQAKKAFFITFIMWILSFCSCTFTIQSYVTEVFAKSGSSLSANNSSLLVSIVQLIGNLVMLNIVERINRRVFKIKCDSFKAKIFKIDSFRLSTFPHQFWPWAATSYSPLTRYFGLISLNTCGCHRFALHVSLFSVQWVYGPYRTL